ncbi:MAG: MarR family winged helix-turn-helix transcriptional regulator [Archangium sp.]
MHKLMRSWVAMQQALRAVDSVNRFWAKSLGLNPEDVLLLMLLAREEHTLTSLGIATGRVRQQVHRSLFRLERRHVVEAASFARRGRVSHWRLTQYGGRMVRCLERRMELWERELEGRVNVETLVHEMRGVLQTLVNRKLDGYFAGLYLPHEVGTDPNLEFLREAMELREEFSVLEERASPVESRKELARQHVEATDLAEGNESAAAWERLWN